MAASAATSATSMTATTTATRFRLGFVHVDGAAVQLRSIELLHSLPRLTIVFHADKRKASRSSRFAIHDYRDLFHFAILAESLSQRLLGSRVSNVPNVQLHD
jgi:hypothetical protein